MKHVQIKYPMEWPRDIAVNYKPKMAAIDPSDWNDYLNKLDEIATKFRFSECSLSMNEKINAKGKVTSAAQSFHKGVCLTFYKNREKYVVCADGFDKTQANLRELLDSLVLRIKESKNKVYFIKE